MEPAEYRRMYELEDRYWWFLAKRRLVRMLIARHVPRPPSIVVDVGCGTGGISAALSAVGGTWIDVDSSELALQLCRERGLRRLVRASVERVPLCSGSADLMLLLDVLYHRNVRDDRAALAECARVLAPGGTVIVTDSALDWLRGPHDEAVHTRKRYRLGEIVAMVEECGLRIVKRTYANSLLLPPTVAFRLARRLVPSEGTHSDVVDVPGWLQRVLLAIQAAERWLLARTSLPLGTTVVLVARKP